MKNPARTPFAAIFQNEVRLNSKRVAPYFMALLCAGNGLLWWGWGPATGRRWAVNADFFIAGALPVYSFMTLPLFTALFMADPVSRDFRVSIDPLILSKPISRAAYLLGKFFGNFFVLACCQSAFVLTWFVLQFVHKPGVVTQDFKVFPYVKHFLVFVVISHLAMAAFYFAVGALTRNAKIVYGLGVAFYPIYITYQTILLSSLPWRWKLVLDPLAMRGRGVHNANAEWLNQLVVVYDTDLIVNRLVMILIAAICLTILYLRFTIAERSRKVEEFSVLNLTGGIGGFYYDQPIAEPTLADRFEPDHSHEKMLLPTITRTTGGIGSHLRQLFAALGIEFRLLLSERSLIVMMPLATFLSILEVVFYNVATDVSYSAANATNTARLLLLFLVGMTVFYTGEAMHRDREMRIEPVLWSAPAPNNVFLLSKFLSTFLLMCGLIFSVGIAALAIQVLRNHTLIDLFAYLRVYGLILLPSTIFVTAVAALANIALRNKHVAYVFSIGMAVGLFYLYNTGYNYWLYNPVLYRLWTYPDLTSAGNNQATILIHRIYCFAASVACLALAHILFQRKSTRGVRMDGRLTSRSWSIMLALVSLTTAIVTGSIISSTH
jgi:ABC-type transport system involved in multi-copper enzyme maturation permease subunit